MLTSKRQILALSVFEFKAMGSPCELRLYANKASTALAGIQKAVAEIERLEEKYSRYKEDNLLYHVNQAAQQGGSIEIDDEFVSLLEYANTCYQQSDGLFDITSGILRKAWDFKSSPKKTNKSILPNQVQLETLLKSVGWQFVHWKNNRLSFDKKGMEIDFGGIVKEYAADCAASICEQEGILHGIVNLGGDINVFGPHPDGSPWLVQIQHPRLAEQKIATVEMTKGGLASSGDYERYLEIKGVRYSHILSPRNGWPVKGMASVTVIADRCIIAGTACTISMLKETQGPAWLEDLGARHIWMDSEQTMGGTSPELRISPGIEEDLNRLIIGKQS